MRTTLPNGRIQLNIIVPHRRTALAGLIVLLGWTGAASAETIRTWQVDDDRVEYPQADFAALDAAVAAAAPGDRIVVAPGIYDANFTVGKTLTFSGPKSGIDARTRQVTETEEAVLQSASGLRLVLSADRIVLDGFLLRIPTSNESEPPGVLLDRGFSGCQVINSVFDHSGLEADSNGQTQTLIYHNRFESDGDLFGLFSDSGPGVALMECDFINAPAWFSASAAVAVTGNSFSGPAFRDETATLHLRQCQNPLVKGNAFIDGASLGLTELQDALVRENTFHESRIWITLVNQDLIVESNRLSRCPIGIYVHNEGPGPSGAVVRQNAVADGDIGVLVSGDAYDNLIQENTITNNRVGIQVSSPAESFSGFNTFRGNEVRGNSEIDCIDLTVGTRTAGTANRWKSNEGGTSSPAGLLKDR